MAERIDGHMHLRPLLAPLPHHSHLRLDERGASDVLAQFFRGSCVLAQRSGSKVGKGPCCAINCNRFQLPSHAALSELVCQFLRRDVVVPFQHSQVGMAGYR